MTGLQNEEGQHMVFQELVDLWVNNEAAIGKLLCSVINEN